MTSRTEIARDPSRHGWGVKVDFVVNERGGLTDFSGNKASILWKHADSILEIERTTISPALKSRGATGYRLSLMARETASEAEQDGIRMAMGILLLALRKGWGLGLSWPDSPIPCRVVDRLASRGLSASGYATVTSHLGMAEFSASFEVGYSAYEVPPARVLLSLELCVASRLETSARSRLVMLVSALEALAQQQKYGADVQKLVSNLSERIERSKIEDQSLKDSLIGQVRGLTRESARRAIVRHLASLGFNAEECRFVEGAYSARSKIVHEGLRVPGLDRLANGMDRLLVRAHERSAGLDVG